MSWKLKCFLHNTKGLIPFRNQLRRWKRAMFGYTASAARNAGTLREGLDQIRVIRQHIDIQQATVLEIGTGWQPIIPLCFSLAGAREVLLTDLHPLMDAATVRASFPAILDNAKLLEEELGVAPAEIEEFVRRGRSATSLAGMLDALRMRYLAPCDMCDSKLPAASVDIVVSHEVLEHIPPPIIEGILAETRRILTPRGIACHLIDNSDHWQHVDRALSRVNFLKYSDSRFRWTHVAELHYQNRLRHSQYRRMFDRAGFDIRLEQREVDAGSRHDLVSGRVQVASQFREFPVDDLATLTSFFLTAPAESAATQLERHSAAGSSIKQGTVTASLTEAAHDREQGSIG